MTDAYRFPMRYYQECDQIFIFGFSRGAYTARVVAGMLHKVGLLTQGNEELIPFTWTPTRTSATKPFLTASKAPSAGRYASISSACGTW